MTGIKFGNHSFSEPEALPVAPSHFSKLAAQPGLYVILVFDERCSPRSYRAIYFGESDNIEARATGTHENHSSWCAEAGTGRQLYRAVSPMPGANKTQRQQAESLLIAEYGTPCNQKLSYDFGRLFGLRGEAL